MSKHIEPWPRRCFFSVNLLGLPWSWARPKVLCQKTSQTPTSTGRNDSRDLLSLLAYAEKLQETQQHLEEVCSLMQHTVPLEGLINAQDNRTLQAAKSCLKRLHVRVEALANVTERTVTTQQIQFMHEMAQTHCRKSNGTDHIKEELDNTPKWIHAKVTAQVTDGFVAWTPPTQEWNAYSTILTEARNQPLCTHRHSRVHVVGYLSKIAIRGESLIATAGYLLLAFLNWFARYDVLSGMEVATAMARKDTTLGSRRCQSAHFPLMLCISCGLQHPSPHLCTVKSIVRLMIAKAHMRGLWEAGVCSCFFTLYVSLSFHADRFHTPGISMRSMCTGACHACTASHCDLRDPGWGDPGSLHCDFFVWHLSAHPLVFSFCPSVASMDGLLRTRHISCLVMIFTSSSWCSFHLFVCFCGCGLVCFCWLFLCFSFCCGCFLFPGFCFVFVSRFLGGMTSHGLAPRIRKACHSTGFTCSN